MRTLVTEVPIWGLALLFIGAMVGLASLGFWLVRRTDFRSPSTGIDTYISAFGTRASTLFGILLVFVIVSEYNSYSDAQRNVQAEATYLAEIVRNTQGFPAGPVRRIHRAVGAYGHEVVTREWKLMEEGRHEQAVTPLLDGIQHTLAGYEPRTESEKAFYGAAVSNFDSLVQARRDRLEASSAHIPAPLLILLFIGAAVFLLTMLPFSAGKDALLGSLVVLLAALAGAGLLATVVLDFPFSGSIAVSNHEFFEGALHGIVRP
jgi:hypothetical protein